MPHGSINDLIFLVFITIHMLVFMTTFMMDKQCPMIMMRSFIITIIILGTFQYKRDTMMTIMVMPISNFTDILHTELVKLLKNSNNTGGWGEFVCMRLCENN